MPREDRGAGFDPGILIMFSRLYVGVHYSDGRSCRNDHGDTDRSAGMQGVSEKTQKSFRIIIYKKHPGQSKSAGVFFSVTQKDDISPSSN